MIDIVQFNIDRKHPWVQKLGFQEFVNASQLRIIIGGDDDRNLKAVRNGSIDILMSPESMKGKDHLHWRNSGLNQVMLSLAKKNNVAVGFALQSILQTEGVKRAQLLGRMMQNVGLCRKYKVKMTLCSFARDIWGLRSASDMQGFGRIIGMTPKEAKEALDFRRTKGGIEIFS